MTVHQIVFREVPRANPRYAPSRNVKFVRARGQILRCEQELPNGHAAVFYQDSRSGELVKQKYREPDPSKVERTGTREAARRIRQMFGRNEWNQSQPIAAE